MLTTRVVYFMPTFDFGNIVRKIVSAAITAAASPIASTIAIAALLTPFVDDIMEFFVKDFDLPSFSVPSIPLPNGSSQLASLLLYSINFDLAISICNSILSFLVGVVNLANQFLLSVLSVIVVSSSYKILRKTLRDYVG